MNRDLIIGWLNKVEDIDIGDTIYIPTDSRKAARTLSTIFRKEIKILSDVDPIRAGRIFLGVQAKDSSWWITLTRVATSPLVGFIKSKQGDVIRTVLDDPERPRRLRLMREDGYTLEEIEEIEGKLSDEEEEDCRVRNLTEQMWSDREGKLFHAVVSSVTPMEKGY